VTRTLLTGGLVFDGTGAPPAAADVLIEGGRIVEVGPGLDGDEAVDVAGRHLLPGLFDCHTHVTLTSINLLGIVQTPFSYRFYETVQNLRATWPPASPWSGTPPAPTPASGRRWPTG
jgi:predicted amidohydrolase YtcJ